MVIHNASAVQCGAFTMALGNPKMYVVNVLEAGKKVTIRCNEDYGFFASTATKEADVNCVQGKWAAVALECDGKRRTKLAFIDRSIDRHVHSRYEFT